MTSQQRLNHLALFHCYKEEVDTSDISDLMTRFCAASSSIVKTVVPSSSTPSKLLYKNCQLPANVKLVSLPAGSFLPRLPIQQEKSSCQDTEPPEKADSKELDFGFPDDSLGVDAEVDDNSANLDEEMRLAAERLAARIALKGSMEKDTSALNANLDEEMRLAAERLAARIALKGSMEKDTSALNANLDEEMRLAAERLAARIALKGSMEKDTSALNVMENNVAPAAFSISGKHLFLFNSV
ncbi:Copper homeostasis protein CutC [Frankliniella fusca]|uniref:Copper homeostasis protein CutC n=1 Tax=Frankliniella fusca TaxID=407009 RepID=A0AAE1HPC6_9NEOP|nr:Copper homeostasis protein CutC [Frankliniella fusca]